MDRGKLFRYAGVLLLAAGVGVTATETTAFASVDSDRLASINVTGDSTAFLGIVGTDAGTTPEFTNRLGSDADVTLDSSAPGAEFDVGDDGSATAPPVTFGLPQGGSEQVGINADAENATVDVSASLADGGTVDLSRVFEIPQAGQVVLTPNVVSTGNSGKYEFELENTGSINVTLDGIGVNETTEPTAAKVGGKNNDEVLTAGGTQVMTNVIDIDSTNPGATVEPFDLQTVDLNTGETVTFEFNRVRTASNGNAPMNGESITITVTFVDGSQKTLDLVP